MTRKVLNVTTKKDLEYVEKNKLSKKKKEEKILKTLS
jgi:hypothetical protein